MPRRSASGYTGELVPVPSDWLVEQGVEEYMGPRSLPLWIADPDWAAFSARSGAAAAAAGLTHRPLADLVADCLRWEQELGLDRADRRAGLSRAQERELLGARSGERLHPGLVQRGVAPAAGVGEVLR